MIHVFSTKSMKSIDYYCYFLLGLPNINYIQKSLYWELPTVDGRNPAPVDR